MLSLKAAVVKVGASALCSLLFMCAAYARAEDRTPRDFNISEQNLAAALSEFARQSQQEILFAPQLVADKRSEGIQGKYPPLIALREILEGTGLLFATTSSGTILIQAPAAAPVEEAPASALPSPADKSTHDGKQSFWSRLRLAQVDRREADGYGAADAEAEKDTGTSDPSQSRLEEIVVTAQKRVERLQDVPIPVTAVSAASLIESNQTRIQDYYSRIPGLNVTPSVQGQQNLSIRGITTGFANPTVAVTIDDVPYGGSGPIVGLMAPDLDPGDLERIEVLRGPQGTLYGASSMGGLFKLVTVDPSTEVTSGRVQAGISGVENGNEVGYNIRGRINVPLGESTAIRASAFARHDPGYIDNVQTGESAINSARLHGGRLSGLWQVSDTFSLKLNALYQAYEGDGQSEVDTLAGLRDLQQNRLIDSGVFERELQFYSLVANVGLGATALTAVTGYTQSDNVDTFDFTSGFGPALLPLYGTVGVPVITKSNVERFTQEVRLSIPLGTRLEWRLGGFYSDQAADFDQDILMINPTNGAFVGPSRLINNGVDHIKEVSGFTDLTVRFTERFDVQAGGRWSRIEQSRDPGTAQRFPPAGNGLVAILPAFTLEPDNVFTYLLTPRFKVSDDLMLYARGATGYRIGGGGTSLPTDNCVRFNFPCEFGPDKTYNYELGAKGSFLDRALVFDASVYYIDWKDIQILNFQAACPCTYNTNGSRAASRGVEVTLQARPVSNLTLEFWTAWNDAKLTEALPVGPGLPVGNEGDRLPLGSRWSGNLSVTRAFPLRNGFSAFVGGSAAYVGSRPGIFVASGRTRNSYPAYKKVDLLARLEKDSWALDVFINNVTNTHAQLSGGAGFFPESSAAVVQPRTMGISLARTL